MEKVKSMKVEEMKQLIRIMKKILNEHDKIVWDIALKEILRLKPKPNKDGWFKFKDCWFNFKLKRREFIVYRRK